MRYSSFFSFFLVLFLLSGCATFFGRKEKQVTFNSEPTGANVYIGGKFMGQTPVNVTIRIEPEYQVAYLKDGMPVKEFTIKPTDFTHDALNKVLCFIDATTGSILFNTPMLVNSMTGACRSFQNGYFQAIGTDGVPSGTQAASVTASSTVMHGF